MTSPQDHYKQYSNLYHDFTEAYTNVHSLTREFYPQAKRFVEHTEPELIRYVDKISHNQSYQGGPFAFEKLVHYMNHFDDFTLMANNLFTDLKTVLEKSDRFMNRLIDIKLKLPKTGSENSDKYYEELMPELTELVTGLKQMPERANGLENKMRKLETDWKKTKEKIH